MNLLKMFVEGEFIFQPVTGMNLYANVGFQDDKYILPAGAPAVDIYGIQSVAAQAANTSAKSGASCLTISPEPHHMPSGQRC